jgi:hypothetical protein
MKTTVRSPRRPLTPATVLLIVAIMSGLLIVLLIAQHAGAATLSGKATGRNTPTAKATGSLPIVESGAERQIPVPCPSNIAVCNQVTTLKLTPGTYRLTINATAAPLCSPDLGDRPWISPLFAVYNAGKVAWDARDGSLARVPFCPAGRVQNPYGPASHLAASTRETFTKPVTLRVNAFGTVSPADVFGSYELPTLTITATRLCPAGHR